MAAKHDIVHTSSGRSYKSYKGGGWVLKLYIQYLY